MFKLIKQLNKELNLPPKAWWGLLIVSVFLLSPFGFNLNEWVVDYLLKVLSGVPEDVLSNLGIAYYAVLMYLLFALVSTVLLSKVSGKFIFQSTWKRIVLFFFGYFGSFVVWKIFAKMILSTGSIAYYRIEIFNSTEAVIFSIPLIIAFLTILAAKRLVRIENLKDVLTASIFLSVTYYFTVWLLFNILDYYID